MLGSHGRIKYSVFAFHALERYSVFAFHALLERVDKKNAINAKTLKTQ
jgi:hypothetical protein